MINKVIQDFYKDAAPFFETGYLREVYSSGKFCICNACDVTYVLFNYIKDERGNQIGVQMAAEEMQVVIEEEEGYEAFIGYLQQNYEDFKTRVFILNDPCLEMMKRYKERGAVNEPTELIDHELEEKVGASSKRYGERLLRKERG